MGRESGSVTSTEGTAVSQTLRRGLSILRLLTDCGPHGLGISEVARRIGLNKATAIRLAKALLEEGFLVQHPDTQCYRLGPEAFAVGLAAEPNYRLQRVAAPMLAGIAERTDDTVLFTVVHGHDNVCLSRHEGTVPMRNQLMKPGDRWPLGVGAGSCAMLAALDDGQITEALRRNRRERAPRFPRCTDAEIWRLIESTWDKGYCLLPGLVIQDSWAVGVCVCDASGQPAASISVATSRTRLGIARSAAIGNYLIESRDRLLGTSGRAGEIYTGQ